MFGLLDLFTKRVGDQIAEYAAAQAAIARRWENWLDPFHACRPAKLTVERRIPARAPAHPPRRPL